MGEDKSLTRGILTTIVFALLLSGGLKVFEDLQINPAACLPGASGDLYLSPLALLPLSADPSSTPARDLRNASYWSTVGSSYSSTIANLVPQTVLGFIQGSEMWKNWTEQYMLNPPSWIDEGPIPALNEMFRSLEAEAVNATDSGAALSDVNGFALSVSSYTLESLDFATWDGLTSLKTLFETGSTEQALCASMPGQLAQLYHSGLDPSVPQGERAQSLGSALAITSVMILLGGLGGFSDEFQTALAGSGLADSWDAIKPSLAGLGAISPDTANLVLVVLQKLAVQFPGSIDTSAGFVTDRIDAMAQVLKNDGDSTADINQKIGDLIQATGSATGPDDIATDADEISYDEGGGIQIGFDSNNKIILYSDASGDRLVAGSYLQQILPGLTPGTAAIIKVTLLDKGISVYLAYSGGNQWSPSVPVDIAQPGEIVTVGLAILTRNEFIQELPQASFSDPVGINWVADNSQITGYTIQGDQLTLNIQQQPFETTSTFSITGDAAESLGYSNGFGASIDLQISDVFGNDRTLRIYYMGYGDVSMGISMGSGFAQVDLFSFDGVRLVIVYEKDMPTGDFHEAVFYPVTPDSLYTLGEPDPYAPPPRVTGFTESLIITDVTTTRSMEYEMATQGGPGDVARVGAEIAYAVAVDKLSLDDVVMINPSQAGPDLYTKDGTVVIEARMLQRTITEVDPTNDITKQLLQMIGSINSDFDADSSVQLGYIILSYVTNQGTINTIILEFVK